MALAAAQPALEAQLVQLFRSLPGTALDAAKGIADAYATYAATGQAGAGAVVIPPTATALFQTTILAAIANPATGNPATIANAFGAAYTAFWMTPPIAVVGGSTGAVSAATGGPALITSLLAMFGNTGNTPETAGKQLAAALHTATLLVVAAVVTPPATAPVPVPLL